MFSDASLPEGGDRPDGRWKELLWLYCGGIRNRYKNLLKGEDNIVYTSVTDGFGTIENNAQPLKQQILEVLEKHNLIATGTTGLMVMGATNLKITQMKSGPLGGDQQIGSMVAEGKLDMVIFLRDPLTSQAHEPDIQALVRLCDVYNVPVATNLASAEIFIKALDRGELSWREVRKTTSQRI